MDILYLLIPMAVVLVLAILAVFAWALHGGQFDDLEREGSRIFTPAAPAVDASPAVASAVDADQLAAAPGTEESTPSPQRPRPEPRERTT